MRRSATRRMARLTQPWDKSHGYRQFHRTAMPPDKVRKMWVTISPPTKRYFLSAGGVGAKILKVMASGATPIALTLK
jgi:hypothetical protein